MVRLTATARVAAEVQNDLFARGGDAHIEVVFKAAVATKRLLELRRSGIDDEEGEVAA